MIKFSVQKNDILDALTTTAKAASTKSVISALEGIHLSLTGNQLTVTGYDLELGIKSTIDVEGESDGVLVLNSRLICDIVRKMPSGVIRFDEYEPLKLNLMCEDITYSIMGINSEEYPVLPELSRGESFEISEPLLKSVIGQTLYAVATIDTKPGLRFAPPSFASPTWNVLLKQILFFAKVSTASQAAFTSGFFSSPPWNLRPSGK